MGKASLYREFLRRSNEAFASDHHLEAIWYVYAVVEDRMISMLENSGGLPQSGLRMLGPKVQELKRRSAQDDLLKVNLDAAAILRWASKRNTLMHAMANGTMDLSTIDVLARETAGEGVKLCRSVCSAAMRVKKHRSKV